VIGRLRQAGRAATLHGARGLAVFLLSLASLVSSGGWLFTEVRSREAEVNLRDHLDDLRHRNGVLTQKLGTLTDELACRSEVATEATNIQAEKMDALGAALLYGLVDDNDAAALAEAERFRSLRDDEQRALERRTEAIEDCDGGGPATHADGTVPPTTNPQE
jgi:hypothetical protein